MFTGKCRFSISRGLSANISFLPLPLPRLSLRAGGRGFSPATCCIYPATWNLSDNPALPQFPVFGSCSFLTWPENPVPRVFLCSERKRFLHRLHRRLGVDFSLRWSMFDSWPRYIFFSFNFVLYFFNHIFLCIGLFPFILIAALLITTSRGVSWWPVL